MEIADQLTIIANHHHRLVVRYHELGKTIAQLTAAGCIDAKEYWKDGRYLYLLYAMKEGRRRKKYIGNHPLRIEEARTKLANYKIRTSVILIQKNVAAELRQIEELTTRLLQICATTDMSAKFALSEMGTNPGNLVADFVPNHLHS